jgi:NAD(P)-dependent dehydrogenase (short-subunit alcohol dehydrogenase family)
MTDSNKDMKNIIITGASRGIGRAAVEYLAKNTAGKILAIARSSEKLEELKNSINPQAEILVYPFDLEKGDYSEIEKFIKGEFSTIDILINNAGALASKPAMELSEEDFDLMFNVNIKSVFQMAKICVPLMVKGSHMVNISSMGGFQGSVKFPGLSLYSASKGAVSTYTESLAAELTEQGISVNALAFGAVDTDMLRTAFPDFQAPLTSTEMGAYLAQFALEAGKFYNGKVLPVSSSTP